MWERKKTTYDADADDDSSRKRFEEILKMFLPFNYSEKNVKRRWRLMRLATRRILSLCCWNTNNPLLLKGIFFENISFISTADKKKKVYTSRYPLYTLAFSPRARSSASKNSTAFDLDFNLFCRSVTIKDMCFAFPPLPNTWDNKWCRLHEGDNLSCLRWTQQTFLRLEFLSFRKFVIHVDLSCCSIYSK